MTSRRQWHLSTLTALVGAVLLAACGGGGGDGPSVSRVISFGDSLSDLGTYAPATQIPLGQAAGVSPFFGGRFTTNNHTDYTLTGSNTNIATIWVESVAARVGVPITQAAGGFAGNEVLCPVATRIPALATSCTGYGQGGSRVTDPNGIGKTGGALTVPVVTQMSRHITRFGSYRADEVVLVWAGNNDVFTQLGAVGLGLPPATAIANLQTAATQLATLVKEQVLAKGASRVAVLNLPDYAILPGFLAAPAPTRALLTQMATEFNASLTAGLAGTNVLMIDVRTLISAIAAQPATYGFVNVTTAACDPAKISVVTRGRVTDGSSLFCNAATGQTFNTLRTGASTSTWAFADGVHPTPGGHKVVSDLVITRMKDAGWIPANQ